ncbi:beta-lactamase-like protein [Lipomyces arxii]|uniref:beta-lactamase-like protein n=1 Tax=Lipomyces arxii TaxID=56418 RepID=UPI0034CFD5A2
MFTFTALLGAASSESTTLASQSLLTFDQNVRILVDVGWDDQFTVELLAELERLTPVIDLIVLTHATIAHLGAYAYACKKFIGFSAIPVYATLPVINMGRMATIDAYSTAWFTSTSGSGSQRSEDLIQSADIDAIFDKIHTLKFSQKLTLTGKLSSLKLTPHNAGHTLGGTLWRLQYGQEDVVYAVEWNHAGERHLSSSVLTSPDHISRPSTFILGARTGTAIRQRDDVLVTAIRRSLDRGGNVLLPTSTSARALELCHLLDAVWSERNVKAPLLFVSRVGSRTLAYARSMLEWMSPSIVREWEDKGILPFTFRTLKILSSVDDIDDYSGPKVVLASGQDLEWGVGREVFAELCNDQKSMTIFTQDADKKSLAGTILSKWASSQAANSKVVVPSYSYIQHAEQIMIRKSVPLQGEELDNYLLEERTRKALAERQLAIDLKNQSILEQEDSESEGSESEDEIEEGNGADASADIFLLTQDNDVYDYDVRTAKLARNRMFPYVPRRVRKDAYGDVIKPEDFMRAEEKVEDLPMSTRKEDDEDKGVLGLKRKWAEEREEEKSVVVPSKTVIEYKDIDVQCEITYIDYEGLADARSIEMIIPQIQPRKLILISGTSEQAGALASTLRQADIQDVYIPSNGQIVNTSMDANGYSVTLSLDFAHELKWQSVASGEYTVAQFRGKIQAIFNGDNAKKAEDLENLIDEPAPVQDLVASPLLTKHDMAVASSQTRPLFVGDVRLAELRRRLMTEGHYAEFRGEGVLLIDGHVAVRKLESGNIVIEGGVSDAFYSVRKSVYSFLARIV